MKIVRCKKELYSRSLNFIDENDVFVGFDYEQHCCESFGWFLADHVTTDDEKGNEDMPSKGYVFDTAFFEELEEGEECSMAVFKLTCDGKPDLYLHLFNVHNGYYSHGFEMCYGETVIHNGAV